MMSKLMVFLLIVCTSAGAVVGAAAMHFAAASSACQAVIEAPASASRGADIGAQRLPKNGERF